MPQSDAEKLPVDHEQYDGKGCPLLACAADYQIISVPSLYPYALTIL